MDVEASRLLLRGLRHSARRTQIEGAWLTVKFVLNNKKSSCMNYAHRLNRILKICIVHTSTVFLLLSIITMDLALSITSSNSVAGPAAEDAR